MVTHRITWARIFILALLAAFVIALVIVGLPEAAKPVAKHLPNFVRGAVSDYIVIPYENKYGVCQAPAGIAALDKIANKITAGSNNKQNYNIAVINDPTSTNGFATPGNKILIFSGMIQEADNPEQLAAVLAHEMSHSILMHPEISLIRDNGIFLTLFAMFGKDPTIGHHLLSLQFSREAEFEADANAVTLLAQAGIPPQALIDFITKVHVDETNELTLRKILKSHPEDDERIARIKQNVPKMQAQPILSAQEWEDLKTICLQ
jgi:predicted Zn-dependent protease